jgi:hypothetical protein
MGIAHSELVHLTIGANGILSILDNCKKRRLLLRFTPVCGVTLVCARNGGRRGGTDTY